MKKAAPVNKKEASEPEPEIAKGKTKFI